MAARHTPNPEPSAPSRTDLESRLLAEARDRFRWWSTGPGDRFDWHRHDFHKVLYCAEGSITFHTLRGDVTLAPGDRLDVEPETEHAATIGPEGVTCVEAAR